MLSKLPDEVTERSERIGRNLALSLQAFIELQPFLEENHFDSDLSLGSAPVLFHLQNDPSLLEYIGTCEGDIDNLNLKKVIYSMDHWLWMEDSFENFQNAIFLKISKIPFIG